jgi:hypothetical protein
MIPSEDGMILLAQLTSYVGLVFAVAGIVAGVERLNQSCPDGAGQRPKLIAIPIADQQARLRQKRS